MQIDVLTFERVGKSFFGAAALREVSFALGSGRVLGLVGENGAGKSTLMNILGGVLQADAGRMLLAGAPYAPRSAADATAAGVAMVHQELNLFTNLSIAENLLLDDLPRRGPTGLRWIDYRALRRRAAELLRAVELDRDPDTPLGWLSPGERQLVEIARALRCDARIVVFDEPTTSLTRREAERLFEIIARLRGEGRSIIYISHSLGDVLRLCDEIVVLRDGEVQAAAPRAEFTVERLIELMVGRLLGQLYPTRETRPGDDNVLEVRGVSQPGVVENIGFALRRGEVLGVAGLMGSGRTELARIIFGLDPFARGEIRVEGRPLKRPSPRRAIGRGMALLTEDRRAEGLLMEASIAENIALVWLDEYAGRGLGLVRRGALTRAVGALAATMGIESRDLERQAARTLSGGNQQKVVLAKWLLGRPTVYILDEPTRGIDVGARHEIYQRINELVARGAGVLMISSDLEELVGLCDRILVMAKGEIRAVVAREEFDRHELLRSALGEERLT